MPKSLHASRGLIQRSYGTEKLRIVSISTEPGRLHRTGTGRQCEIQHRNRDRHTMILCLYDVWKLRRCAVPEWSHAIQNGFGCKVARKEAQNEWRSMKLRLVVCWLLLVEGGFCDCQEVKGEPPVQSSQRITVTVEKQGKPVQGAKVAVSGSSLPQAGITVVTDSAGVAKLPTLETGTYSIQATFEGGIAATALSVKQKTFVKPTQLTFALVHSPSRMDLVAAQSNQVTWQTKVFAGAVKDPSGAPIPNASIQIFKKGELDEWNGTLLYADQNGRFTVPLPDGEYLAFFQSSGFQSRIAAFEINPEADQAVVPVILQIAATCAELQDHPTEYPSAFSKRL